MDIVLELGTERLLDIVRVKFAQQGVAPDLQFDALGERWILHDLAVTNLILSVQEMVSRSWNRPVLGPALDLFTFIPVQRVRGRFRVRLGFTTLARLRDHSPGAAGPPRRENYSIDVVFEPLLRVAGGGVTLGIDVQDVLDIAIPVPDDATEEQRRAIADQERAIRARAIALLRDAARGLDVALPIGVLGGLIPGVTRVLNAAFVAEPRFTATGALDPTAGARFLQIGIQLDRPEWALLTELQRNQLIIRKGEAWRAFHRAPIQRSERFGFAIFLSAESMVATTRSIITSSVASASDRIRLRGPVAARWVEPASAVAQGNVVLEFPITAFNACGTGHHLDADVTARIRFAIPAPDRIQIAVTLDYGAAFFPLVGCAFEAGGIGAAIGLVIGGVFGGWIGALVGAIAGFLIGFIGVLIVGATYRTSLGGLPSYCEETARRDVRCAFPLPPAGTDPILGAIRLRNARAGEDGLAILAALEFPAPGVPPRLEATVFEPLRWSRSGRAGWSMRGRVYLTNVGGGEVVLGAAVAIGEGAGLYWGRLRMPRFPLFSRASAWLDVDVPRAEVEAARAAGTLAPAEILVFSTGGVRRVRFAAVPDALTDDQIELSDSIEQARIELDRIGHGLAVLGSPIPPVPGLHEALGLNPVALFQASVRGGAPKGRWALATEDGRLLAHAVADDLGSVFLAGVGAPPESDLRLVNLPVEAGKDLAAEVKQAVDKGATFFAEMAQALRAAVGGALLGDPDDDGKDAGEPVVALGLERPAILSKVDVAGLRQAVTALAARFGHRDQDLEVQARSSLLAEMQAIPASGVTPLVHVPVDGEARIGTIVDQVPVLLSVDGAGRFHAEDAQGGGQGEEPWGAAQAAALSQSLPEGFVEHQGVLVGWREGVEPGSRRLGVYAMVDAAR